ncbi:hypothetical protein A3I40_03230 [Candidatus Uhrbacteria bacterium RIFCSPLOWO2_02_FULL_48_12]|uniref:50S ribosomal protein L7/L12 n=1 Tax=Candidatus Uhrbacteria bacterium RIFCSPLOWO2_02_FULL_48_12 TaxID=1802407 RepID=A0A1F7V693_9BACT|nr:MAG: hypothetical protein A3I40_03230 [Candidatus Uhrbacteria bacterium RIFCSPLOWO2_02_FULL_48_12]
MVSQKTQNNEETNISENTNLKDESASNTGADNEISAKAASAKLALAMELVTQAENMLVQARQLIQTTVSLPLPKITRTIESADAGIDDSRTIEGVFDGQQMIGPDGKHYSVPANYASKSKLIEGDLLKLTITAKGAFVYKQIGPIARRRLRGVLIRNQAGHEYSVKVHDRLYRVLTASVTYFKGHEGDEVIILVPENGESKWAAVENIMKSADQSNETRSLEPEAMPSFPSNNSVSSDDLI